MQSAHSISASILQDMQRWPQQAYNWLERQAIIHPELSYVILVITILAALFALYLLYRLVPGLKYEIQLWLHKIFESGHRQYVLRVLRDEKVPVEIMRVTKEGVDHIATGLIHHVPGNVIRIKITQNFGVTKSIKGSHLYCYYKPILHFTIRTNSFKTYATSFEHDRYGNDLLGVKMPVTMDVQERRRHKRKRIRTQRTIMARAWLRDPDSAANGKFRYAQSSFQVNVEKGLGNRAQERFFDISAHGARLGVQRSLIRDDVSPDSGVCIEIRPYIKDDKKFYSFYFAGKIRHVVQARSGLLIMGLQFDRVAVRGATPTAPFEWEAIDRSPVTKLFRRAIAQL
ncbi:MAG: hypothetical protein ACOCVM_04605 [Desulfovibrionaceae bacterium]